MVSPPLHGPGWAARFPVLLLGFMGGEDKSGPRPMTAQRRLALGFAIAVELRAGLGDFRLIAQRPGAERRDRLQQVAAERGQRIIDPRRNGGNTVRVTRPSRSSPRSVRVSMRCEMPPIERRNSLKRSGPSPSRLTTRTDHLSPIRDRTSLMARQSAGKSLSLGFTDVPSCVFSL